MFLHHMQGVSQKDLARHLHTIERGYHYRYEREEKRITSPLCPQTDFSSTETWLSQAREQYAVSSYARQIDLATLSNPSVLSPACISLKDTLNRQTRACLSQEKSTSGAFSFASQRNFSGVSTLFEPACLSTEQVYKHFKQSINDIEKRLHALK